jgi:hypothetical protein
LNRCTKLLVVIIGIITGSTGFLHGLAEVMQGNKPTNGVMMADIGAMSLIPNYLFTGIAAMFFGVSMIVWTASSIHKKNGPAVFMTISILLFLTGGGIMMALPVLITWVLATRLDKPLNWWRKVLPERSRKTLSGLWKFSFVSCFVSLLTAILIWIFLTPPGPVYKPPAYVYTCWSFLLLTLVFLVMTIITGFARDINARDGLAL